MPELLGKQVGAIGYGLMGLTWKKSPPPRDQSLKAMRAALEAGADCWNGGEFYGTPEYNSLHLLAEYFTKYPEDADKVVLSIKGGTKIGPYPIPDASEANVKRSVDECLRLLDGKKKLDLFECARVDPKVPIEISIGVLAEYIRAGKLGGISLSECSADSIRRAAKVHKISAVEVEYSLWSTEIESNGVAEACAELQIPIIAYSPLGRGFLTGTIKSVDDFDEHDHRRTFPRFQPDVFDKNLELVHDIEKLAKKKGCTPGQIATAWVLEQQEKLGAVIIPIPGASHEDRVKENTVAVKLSKDEVAELNEVVKKATVLGGRYPNDSFNFGNSPPLQQ